MKWGDISNEPGPQVAVRWEFVVWDPTGGKPNLVGKAHVEKLWNKNDVLILTSGEERKAKAKCYKWNIPYTKLIGVDSVLEIPQIIQAHHIEAYWDVDNRVLDNVKSSGPHKIETFKWEQDGPGKIYSSYV